MFLSKLAAGSSSISFSALVSRNYRLSQYTVYLYVYVYINMYAYINSDIYIYIYIHVVN